MPSPAEGPAASRRASAGPGSPPHNGDTDPDYRALLAELRAGSRAGVRTDSALGALMRAELALAWRSSIQLLLAALAAFIAASLLWLLTWALIAWWLLAAGLELPTVLGLLAVVHGLLVAGLLVMMRNLRAQLLMRRSRAALGRLRTKLSGRTAAR